MYQWNANENDVYASEYCDLDPISRLDTYPSPDTTQCYNWRIEEKRMEQATMKERVVNETKWNRLRWSWSWITLVKKKTGVWPHEKNKRIKEWMRGVFLYEASISRTNQLPLVFNISERIKIKIENCQNQNVTSINEFLRKFQGVLVALRWESETSSFSIKVNTWSRYWKKLSENAS